MSNMLSSLQKNRGLKSKSKRVGRGFGSRGGHTTGKGNKGQKSRSGGKSKVWFEGGQTPLIKRLPYLRGFNNPNSVQVCEVNIGEIDTVAKAGDVINPAYLHDKALIEYHGKELVKILGRGQLTKKVSFEGVALAKKAEEKIKQSGSTITTSP